MKITRYGRSIPKGAATIGGDPSLPPGSDPAPDCCEPGETPPDRAGQDGASVVKLSLGSAGAISIVQTKAPTPGTDTIVTLDSTPTPGNLLVLWHATRDNNEPTTPVGFTAVGASYVSAQFSSGADKDRARFFYRLVQTGDSATITNVSDGTGVKANVFVAEVAGAGALDVTSSLSNQAQSGTDVTTSAVTPTDDCILFGGFTIFIGDAGTETFTPNGTSTELHDSEPSGFHPLSVVVYRIIASPSGSYTLGGDSSAAHTGGWGGQAAAFIAAEPTWSVNAPNAIDGDDATYEVIPSSGTSTGVLRVDLGTPLRIVRSRLRIGTQNSGSKTYTIKGANAADFSDEVTLASVTFTATGTYTAQDVAFLWTTTESYRYFELSSSVAESRRIYTWELFEETPGSIVITDPTTGSAGELQDVVDNLDAATDSHLADTVDAHDASAISVLDTGGYFTGTTVEAALAELAAAGSLSGIWHPVMAYDGTNWMVVVDGDGTAVMAQN